MASKSPGVAAAALFLALQGFLVHALAVPVPPGASDSIGMLGSDFPAALAQWLPLAGLRPTHPPLPADPPGALAAEVAAFLADLGFSHDPSAEIAAASLEPVLAGRLAQALSALHGCYAAAQDALDAVPLADLALLFHGAPWQGDAGALAGIRGCALPAAQSIADLEAAGLLASASASTPPSLDVWPVVKVDATGDDVHENDYILLVDLDGDDLYDNNAGGNLIDVRFAPASSPFPGVDPIPHIPGANDGDDDRSGFGPSEGCTVAARSVAAGNCTILVSAFVDTDGNDQYGVFKSPVAGLDARCTADAVIRRMVTNGAAAFGFGMLVDSSGNDRYNGRQASTGSGHVFGVGILHDREGDDRYLDSMLAQGFGLIGSLGLLVDEAGDDRYEHYLPSPLVPGTPDEVDGAGGMLDDTGKCDTVTRSLQGSAFLGGAWGVLLDLDGQDLYDAACPQTYLASLGPKPLGAPACGQGFGGRGSFGFLADRGGDADTYLGVPDRGNGALLLRMGGRAGADPNDPTGTGTDVILSWEAFSDG